MGQMAAAGCDFNAPTAVLVEVQYAALGQMFTAGCRVHNVAINVTLAQKRVEREGAQQRSLVIRPPSRRLFIRGICRIAQAHYRSP